MFKYNYSLNDFLSGKKNFNYFSKKNNKRIKYGIFTGVVFFGKKKIFEQIGAFDENFWLSLEEYDYLLRAKTLGYKTATIGAITAFHLGGLTRNIMDTDGGVANQKYFESKWGWNFEKFEAKFIPKKIKSIQKIMFSRFNLMSTLNINLPLKK
jgi:hypothetical protein